MRAIATLLTGALLAACAVDPATETTASQNFERDPPCVSVWVTYASSHGFACHAENGYWVANETSWVSQQDVECNKPDRVFCNEPHHFDWLWDTYDQCCAGHGGCAVAACPFWN